MSGPTILLTNDDGIDSPGFRRLYDTLEEHGEVVAVAPSTNRSAVGRSIDSTVTVDEHELGYSVDGSPSACVVTGVTALGIDPDLVVSGINLGANLGAAMLGRSGTVGAAIEAAYLGRPAIAVSMYVPFERIQGEFFEYRPDPESYDVGVHTVATLIERAGFAGAFDHADYLNVNVPMREDLERPELRVTRPADGYFTVAEDEGDRFSLRDRQFELLYAGEVGEDGLTDRGALAEGAISVSPLIVPHHDVGEDVRSSIGASLDAELVSELGLE